MKDIPMFTTEFGIASLTLGQIPYRETAYIQVQTFCAGKLPELIQECAGFCRAAGAERIFWTADDVEAQPHSSILQLRGEARPDPSLIENLFPVTEQTAAHWRRLHNDRMAAVDHARYLTAADETQLLTSDAYFIHRSGELLGIGWLEDDCIMAIASLKPGAGERVLHTLMSLAPERMLTLEVASTNAKALALYEKNGFVPIKTLKKWYAVQ
jgi:hypothetical protein